MVTRESFSLLTGMDSHFPTMLIQKVTDLTFVLPSSLIFLIPSVAISLALGVLGRMGRLYDSMKSGYLLHSKFTKPFWQGNTDSSLKLSSPK